LPKTRPAVSRDQKVDEILACAELRLREGGYEALSVAAIARELGLAQNAIYWYFASKDELFVAALQRMLAEIAARKPRKEDADEIERILWFTDQYKALSDLRPAISERARRSAVVAKFAKDLDALLSRMLSNVLSDRLPPEDLPIAVEAFRATVEGTTARGLSRQHQRRVIDFALRRLIGR
jgi:AcrR family transcriptional regulator